MSDEELVARLRKTIFERIEQCLADAKAGGEVTSWMIEMDMERQLAEAGAADA